jgi:hypothetical protein
MKSIRISPLDGWFDLISHRLQEGFLYEDS